MSIKFTGEKTKPEDITFYTADNTSMFVTLILSNASPRKGRSTRAQPSVKLTLQLVFELYQ